MATALRVVTSVTTFVPEPGQSTAGARKPFIYSSYPTTLSVPPPVAGFAVTCCPRQGLPPPRTGLAKLTPIKGKQAERAPVLYQAAWPERLKVCAAERRRGLGWRQAR